MHSCDAIGRYDVLVSHVFFPASELPPERRRAVYRAMLDRLRSFRGGKLSASAWGSRMKGEGIFAEQLRTLFDVSLRRAGLKRERLPVSTEHFRRPGEQLTLF